jgi:hypothetical protein
VTKNNPTIFRMTLPPLTDRIRMSRIAVLEKLWGVTNIATPHFFGRKEVGGVTRHTPLYKFRFTKPSKL